MCGELADPDPVKAPSRGHTIEPATAEPSQQADEASKLSVWLQDGHGFKKKFKLRKTDPFSKLMKAVQQHLAKNGKAKETDSISYTWDGESLGPEQSPEELGWEDEESVDVVW